MNQVKADARAKKRARAAWASFALSVVVHALVIAGIFAWMRLQTENDEDEPVPVRSEEEPLAEVIFDETPPAPDTDDDTFEESDEALTAEPQTSDPVQEPQQTAQPAEPDPVEPPEPQEEPPPQPPDVDRQSVAQPTTNEQVPESEDYFYSDVDNRAEEQTQAEDTVAETEAEAATTERERQESEQDTPRDADADSEAEADEQREEIEPENPTPEADDEREEERRGAEEQQVAAASEEGAREREQEERVEAEQELAEGERTPVAEDGDVAPGQQGEASLDQFDVERRVRQTFESAAGSGEEGSGRDSVSRDGLASAAASFDQLFGDRTAQGRENLEQERRRESLAGDHAGDWERTREALSNFDIAVTAGTETHLNTRQNEHASFIHGYHNELHPRWWRFLGMLNASHSPSHPVSDLELVTRLEIRVMADGKVDQVRIISGSGSTYFDAEAIRIQYDIGEVPAPHDAIVCDDGSVYLHWTVSRTPGRCGTHRASVHCPRGS